MADRVSRELDRLITQGHQDSSLMPAIQRLLTKDEIEAFIADRSLRVKRSQQELAERTDDVPEE
jgi:hypothetical protein